MTGTRDGATDYVDADLRMPDKIPASDIHAEVVAEGARRYNASADTAQTRRDRAEATRLLSGLEILEHDWVVQLLEQVIGLRQQRGRYQADRKVSGKFPIG